MTSSNPVIKLFFSCYKFTGTKLSFFVALGVEERFQFSSVFEVSRLLFFFSTRNGFSAIWFQGFYELVGWWTGLSGILRARGESRSKVITGIPSYRTFVVRAWLTEIFLVKCFRKVEGICVNITRLTLAVIVSGTLGWFSNMTWTSDDKGNTRGIVWVLFNCDHI